jgi:NADH-quinone oxidoreductase subunit M
LPEAHVEAPTAGSVILAGLLLKLGTYGFIRFLIPLFPDACSFFSPLVHTICLMGIIYTSLTTIRQIDLKKIIAYSSVGHMNYVILGLFTTNFEGVVGSIYLMLSHGIVSSALFICVGIVYDRYKTRNIFHLRGLVQYMPIYAIFVLFFTLANVSFPGTSSFVGEFLILIGIAENNMFATLLATFSIIFSMVYSF